MDAEAIQAAAKASATSYGSFADATRAVLDLLAASLPEDGLYLAHLDRGQGIHRIVDTRGGAAFGLRANAASPLEESLDLPMAEDRTARRCGDVHRHPLLGTLPMAVSTGAVSYLGVPLELSDGSRVGALTVLSSVPDRFGDQDESLLTMLARVLAHELERETNERDLRRLNESMRSQARTMGALARVARALATEEDPRPELCAAACEAADAPVAFLLEPSGREFVSTAMHGVQMAPVTIQARAEGTRGRSFMTNAPLFVSDAAKHPSLAEALVQATGARSALFEPILREETVIGVLIVVWQEPLAALRDSTAAAMHLLAAQAAVAMDQAGLRRRVDSLSLSDPLTGLATKRWFDTELPRELARTRRGEQPMAVALIDIDHMAAFNLLQGEREGDKLIKEAASFWAGALREVDLLARMDGEEFVVILPNCGAAEAIEVIDRLRELTPRGQTASAGVARWDGSEPAEILMLRASTALAAAKAGGRNITVVAD